MSIVGVYIGRFQPWHIGHEDALDQVLGIHKTAIIVLGSANEMRTANNPWNVYERTEIIRRSITNEKCNNIEILSIDDHPSDDIWFDSLDSMLPSKYIVYSGNEWVIEICNNKSQSCAKITQNIDISATQIRDSIRLGIPMSKYTIVNDFP